MRSKGFLVSMGEADLAARRRRLLLLELERPGGKPEMTPPDGDGARGDDHYLNTGTTQLDDILGEPSQAGALNGARRFND